MLTLHAHVVHSHHLFSQCWWYRKWCQLMVQCWVLLLMAATLLNLLRCSPTWWTRCGLISQIKVLYSFLAFYSIFVFFLWRFYCFILFQESCTTVSGRSAVKQNSLFHSLYFHAISLTRPISPILSSTLSCDGCRTSNLSENVTIFFPLLNIEEANISQCAFFDTRQWAQHIYSSIIINLNQKNMNLKLGRKWLQLTEN